MRRNPDGGSLVARAIQSVRDHIRVHALRAGDPLPGEAYFAEAEGVSRAVIREAFGALAALRLIDVANGRRARVGAMDGAVLAVSLDHAVMTGQVTTANARDLYRALALHGAERAAAERTQAEAAEILALARDATAGNDLALRAAIAHAAHNKLLVHIMSAFVPLLEAPARSAGDRLALAQAIMDRDSVAARAMMDVHLNTNMVGKAAH